MRRNDDQMLTRSVAPPRRLRRRDFITTLLGAAAVVPVVDWLGRRPRPQRLPGRMRLVVEVPRDPFRQWLLGRSLGAFLHDAADEDIAPLAFVALACAPPDREPSGAVESEGPYALVVEGPAGTRRIGFALESPPDDAAVERARAGLDETWDQAYARLDDLPARRRMAAIAGAIRQAVVPGIVPEVGPSLVSDPASDSGYATAALARMVRARLVDTPVPGARWVYYLVDCDEHVFATAPRELPQQPNVICCGSSYAGSLEQRYRRFLGEHSRDRDFFALYTDHAWQA